jgi:hypothetical protein
MGELIPCQRGGEAGVLPVGAWTVASVSGLTHTNFRRRFCLQAPRCDGNVHDSLSSLVAGPATAQSPLMTWPIARVGRSTEKQQSLDRMAQAVRLGEATWGQNQRRRAGMDGLLPISPQ